MSSSERGMTTVHGKQIILGIPMVPSMAGNKICNVWVWY